ncbi:MAG: hypothetical protein Q7J82_09910 [Coriobacteriia bacterium]|nr:hypothetical protein [Coriobacteriia bacterium]
MRRLMIAGGISLALVLTTVVLMGFYDSGLARLLSFIFLQYPAMLIGYIADNEVSVYALGLVAWILWSVVIYAILWFVETFVDGLKGVDRLSEPGLTRASSRKRARVR